jgi:O-6-methylguanine DNA methyltransferase
MLAVTTPLPSRRTALSALRLDPDARRGDNPHLLVARAELVRYFQGDPATDLARIRLDPRRGTAFEREVWRSIRAVPRGQVRTYGEIARAAGRPLAARAVGRCNAKNPWAIVVPCHRLIGSDGALTGYGGGLAMKRRLLEWEGIDVGALAVGSRHRRPVHAHRD